MTLKRHQALGPYQSRIRQKPPFSHGRFTVSLGQDYNKTTSQNVILLRSKYCRRRGHENPPPAVDGALPSSFSQDFVKYRSIKKTRMRSIVANSAGIWMPVVLLVQWLAPSIRPLWLTMPFYCGVCALACIVRFLQGKWKSFRLEDDLVTGKT